MKKSPFKYGTTVSEAAFTNREQEVKQLYNNLTQGINTTIISPRRWGKSSLVEKVAKNIVEREQSTRIVLIDLFSVASQEEFLELYAKEVIKASSPKWQDWVKSGKTFFKQLVPRFTIGMDPQTDFSLSFDWQEMKQHKNEILNLPRNHCRKERTPLCNMP
jgi:AAA+ ATPase superfamily predicted ATPase